MSQKIIDYIKAHIQSLEKELQNTDESKHYSDYMYFTGCLYTAKHILSNAENILNLEEGSDE